MTTTRMLTYAGIQLTSVSHVEDVAAMMAASAGNPAAYKQHYNACSDRTYTLDGIAQCVAAALGKEPKIVHYNVKDFDIPNGKGFPFRTVHFFASADKAKRDLGWKAEHRFAEDLQTQVCLCLRRWRGKVFWLWQPEHRFAGRERQPFLHVHAVCQACQASDTQSPGLMLHFSLLLRAYQKLHRNANTMMAVDSAGLIQSAFRVQVELYKAAGRADKDVDFSVDDMILA
jgi:hypothetical protein